MLDDDNAGNSASSLKTPTKTKQLSRRAVLKAGAAATGAAIGSDVVRGFPTIWAQEIKDIELRHVGVSYSVVKAIGDQAAKDLGFKVTIDTPAATSTGAIKPERIDNVGVVGSDQQAPAPSNVVHTPVAAVLGKEIVRAPKKHLAFTGLGLPVGPTVGLGLLLIGGGAFILAMAGRRRPRRDES